MSDNIIDKLIAVNNWYIKLNGMSSSEIAYYLVENKIILNAETGEINATTKTNKDNAHDCARRSSVCVRKSSDNC